VFALLKVAYREQVDQLERGGVNTISKQHFTSLFSLAREKVFTPKNIKASFATSGLFLFNPDRVLRHMPKPPTNLTIPKANKVKVRSCPQDVVPQTPVTPVSAKGFMSLQNLIIKQNAYTLDDTSKQKLERHVLKLTKAGQMFLVKDALQEDQIQFLNTINNKAKVQRSTKSLVLGKAKVMSYEDLKEARVKRANKEAAKEAKGKGKRGRKRKSAALEADAPEPNAKVVQMSEAPSPARASVVQMSGTPVAEDEIVPEPWRAPVAQMY